jgi:hypothetical protein
MLRCPPRSLTLLASPSSGLYGVAIWKKGLGRHWYLRLPCSTGQYDGVHQESCFKFIIARLWAGCQHAGLAHAQQPVPKNDRKRFEL